jgi:hypothetical protein
MGSCLGACAGAMLCGCISESCSSCGKSMGNDMATKLIYSFLLLLVSIVGYIFANIPNWLDKTTYLKDIINYFAFAGCTENSCFGTLATYRVASAAAVFHAFMALILIGVKSKSEFRSVIQDGWWAIKILVIVAIAVGFFFIPNAGFVYYGYFALCGSFVFIIIQLVYLIDMAHSWTESWVANYEKTESKCWAFALMGVSVLFYVLSITATVLMYVFYTEKSNGCWINEMCITLNIVFCFFITCLSIHPKIQEKNPKSGLLQSAIITLYSTYLVYSAIISEPDTMNCTTLRIDPNSPAAIIMLIVGVFFTFLAIIYSAISTGTSGGMDENSKLITERKDKDEDTESKSKDLPEEDIPVSYNYTFFHVTFALAVMYLSMVLTNWVLVQEDTDSFSALPSISPAWVKVSSSWVTLLLYLWTLIAPLILSNRVFNRD